MEEILKKYSKDEQEKIIMSIISLAKHIDDMISQYGYLETMKWVYSEMDKYEIEKPVSCTSGCSFCCYLHVTVSQLEIVPIIDYCNKNNIDIDISVLEKQEHANNVDEFATIPYKDRKCVFLKDNKCSIYPVRPLACRKYYVVNDPEICNSEHVLNTTLVRYSLKKEITAYAVWLLSEPTSFSKNLKKCLQENK